MKESFLGYKDESIVVTSPILEMYVPYEYSSNGLYSLDGESVKMFGIANFRVFTKESEIKTRENKDAYPLCIGAYILTKPSETEIDEVALYVGAKKRKCMILRYYKGDMFIVNRNIIKSIKNMSVLMTLLEAGKLDILPYDPISRAIVAAQTIDNISLGLPEEDIDGIVAERFRDPKNPNKKARFMNNYPKEVVSVNPREEINMTSTFNAFGFEDVNTALIVSHNRAISGVKEPENKMEKIIKGEKIEVE